MHSTQRILATGLDYICLVYLCVQVYMAHAVHDCSVSQVVTRVVLNYNVITNDTNSS